MRGLSETRDLRLVVVSGTRGLQWGHGQWDMGALDGRSYQLLLCRSYPSHLHVLSTSCLLWRIEGHGQAEFLEPFRLLALFFFISRSAHLMPGPEEELNS